MIARKGPKFALQATQGGAVGFPYHLNRRIEP